jgi:hypothetical protein
MYKTSLTKLGVSGSGSVNKRNDDLSGKHFLRPDSWGLDRAKTPCRFRFPYSPSSFWDEGKRFRYEKKAFFDRVMAFLNTKT